MHDLLLIAEAYPLWFYYITFTHLKDPSTSSTSACILLLYTFPQINADKKTPFDLECVITIIWFRFVIDHANQVPKLEKKNALGSDDSLLITLPICSSMLMSRASGEGEL